MQRKKIINLLNSYLPNDADEKKYKTHMLEFVQTHGDCFERTLEVGHITGSAWILNKPKTHALLTHHTKLDRWFQLGGHCDGDHDVLAVAIKEAQEESGIKNIVPVSENIFDIDIHLLPETSHHKAHYHYDVRFLLWVAGNEEIVHNHESKELRWIGKNANELPTQSQSVVRMFNKWKEVV